MRLKRVWGRPPVGAQQLGDAVTNRLVVYLSSQSRANSLRNIPGAGSPKGFIRTTGSRSKPNTSKLRLTQPSWAQWRFGWYNTVSDA